MELSRDPVIEPCANGEEQVAGVHGHVGRIGTVHAQVANKEGMTCGKCAPSHDCGHHRNPCLLHQLCEGFTGVSDVYAPARQEQRSLRLGEHLDGSLELADMYVGIGLVAPYIDLRRVLGTSQLSHHVLGQVHEYRAGTSCPGDVEGFLYDPSQVLPVAHCDAVLRDAPCDAHDIHLLEGVISYEMPCHLSCKAHKRNAVVVCRGKSRHQVRGAGAAGHQAYSHLSRGSGVGIRLVDESHLLAGQYHPGVVLFIELITDIDRTGAGIAEDGVHSLLLQRFHKQFVSRNFFHTIPP